MRGAGANPSASGFLGWAHSRPASAGRRVVAATRYFLRCRTRSTVTCRFPGDRVPWLAGLPGFFGLAGFAGFPGGAGFLACQACRVTGFFGLAGFAGFLGGAGFLGLPNRRGGNHPPGRLRPVSRYRYYRQCAFVGRHGDPVLLRPGNQAVLRSRVVRGPKPSGTNRDLLGSPFNRAAQWAVSSI
jgi:hypothetical protein